jgi:hypothetical protein
MMLRRGVPLAATAGLALAIAGVGAAAAPAAGPYVCSGTFKTPGVLKGTYADGAVVRGVCEVNAGKAHVIGTLLVTKGSALGAVFGAHHSSLTVTGNLVVGKGGVAFLGCKANPDGKGAACLDDPNMKHPTLKSRTVVSGSIVENSPLGVIVHNSSIGGNLKETGGGGGLSCKPPKSGIFAAIKSPVFSDLEDSTVRGNVVVSGLKSCWTGLARDRIGGSLTINNNTMADPDAIEVLANHIAKNLSCAGNGHPAGLPAIAQPVWDSADTSPSGALYPRGAEPNTVGGTRSGQCVLASPATPGGSSGPGAF